MTGVERIAEAFARARADGKRAALMPYMMGGFPDLDRSRGVAEAYADSGADLVEFGIPFSDPLADGPVIHAAGTAALRAGVTAADALGLAAVIADRVPVVVMCYSNQIYARGLERFVGGLADVGACGLIVPDLPLEEAPAVLEACDARGIALVPLVAPTTPEDRLARIGARARGFVYTVSLTGTTGERAALDGGLAGVLSRVKANTQVPVAVGFGIGTPEQVSDAAQAGADGVIIGSRLVRAAAESPDPAAAVGTLVGEFSRALAR
jgi:tryptophan synthase alpha chain